MKYIVRHGVMRFLGDFDPGPDAQYCRNQDVIIETERGLEVGEVLCESTQRAVEYIEEPTSGNRLAPKSSSTTTMISMISVKPRLPTGTP